ncbi:hypothetical protein MPER_08556, partial [Moniliophthora perniciosa FA553]
MADDNKEQYIPCYTSSERTDLVLNGYPMVLAPLPYKVPKIGGWSPPTSESGLPSKPGTVCGSETHAKSRAEAFQNDQRCLLTGWRSVASVLAHLIEPIRPRSATSGLSAVQTKEKYNIERTLTEFGFNGNAPYQLDGLCNCFLLKADYHCQWDTYHLMCFSPSKEALKECNADLESDNKIWAELCRHGSSGRPNIAALKLSAKLNVSGLELLILRPTQFLSRDDERVMARVGDEPRLISLPSRTAFGSSPVSPFALIHNAYNK